ncbi:MAG: PEP-CTERM sorting domain-containing protein, partial [Akkermansia sp.]|nr:PEP-CTERM sorting domain-containing protein [Akkermansia sp.]
DTWTLVGISFKGGNAAADGARYFAGTGNNNYFTRNLGGFDTPGEGDLTFAIGSGNSGNSREPFNGQIAGLTIFTSSSVIGGVNDVTKYMGTVAPVAIPEPATATLSLLALAGLAARRRRK